MYKKIVVPVDGSAPSMRGLSEAIELAKSHGSRLQLVHVINESMLMTSDAPMKYIEKVISSMKEEGRAVLAEAERVVREHALDSDAVLLESVDGRAAQRIVEQAKQWQADLIVMGTHGRRGLSHLALGSDAERVVRSSPVPVLLVRAEAARS